MLRSSAALATAGALILIAAPASAAAKSCGTVKGVGNQTAVSGVKTSSGSCQTAKIVAKRFARTRFDPKGYTCREKLSPPTPTTSARVTCKNEDRSITFNVVWNGSVPGGSDNSGRSLPAAPALPTGNG